MIHEEGSDSADPFGYGIDAQSTAHATRGQIGQRPAATGNDSE
jgi:hypothetical protein